MMRGSVVPFFLLLSLLTLPASAQEVVYVVRHAEQVKGTENPHLTMAGRQRAQLLAKFLDDAGITAVYSSHASRTVQTATPTATMAGVQVSQVPRADTAALIERIRREQPTGRVLVVGHSETVPQILAGLGHPTPITIDKADYDNVFVVVPREGTAPLVVRQRLDVEPTSVFEATIDPNAKVPEISTKELLGIIASGGSMVLDARPPMEYAISHIPGALNVAPQPGRPAHLYVSDVAEIGRLTRGNKSKPLVLYCNGPFCGKTKRLSGQLLEDGYANVRTYQLGAPTWRALSGKAMQTELVALPYIRSDPTTVWIDAREPSHFTGGSVAGAKNIPASGLRPGKDQGVMKEAKDDARLPMDDHNTRIVVFGADGNQARAVADAIASEAFHNVTFVAAPAEQLLLSVR